MGLLKGTPLGPYEIVALLDVGGMGEVYRARDTRLGRDVAIKVLPVEFAADPERLRRFEQEARAVAALDHPNILAIHDIGSAVVSLRGTEGAEAIPAQTSGLPRPLRGLAVTEGVGEVVHYLVTELLEGEALRDRIQAGPLPPHKAVAIAVQLAHGLAAAHEKGIIHRDLKPTNVFLTEGDHVKILDFGIAKLTPPPNAEEQARATTVVEATGAGTTVGTVGYMSPEQVRGQAVDHRSDIFSFGCVLYEMLSGRSPFRRDTAPDTVSAVLREEPVGLPGGVPPGLEQIVRRCLEKRPADRFHSAHDLALALEAAGSSDSAVAIPFPVRRRTLTRLWIIPVAVVAMVAVGAGLWPRLLRRSDRLPPFRTRQVIGQLGMEGKVSISPSGNEIAYVVKGDGKSRILITDIHGGSPLRLADQPGYVIDPEWFPDGSTVAFTAGGGPASAIWKVPRFGGTPMLLVSNAEQAALSPDGTRIAFARQAEDGLLRIWVARLAALDQPRRITGPDDGLWSHSSPAWSPDSRTICYADARDLWLVPADGGKPHALMRDAPVDSQPAWSTDGRSIYFNSTREGTQAVWRVPAGGGQPIRVTDGSGSEGFPSLSRDGRRLAFVSRRLTGSIALADLQTGRVARVQEGGFSWLPALAPDCSSLVFVSELPDSVTLRSVPLRDGAPAGESVPLVDHPGDVVSPAFSPDGRWVAYYRVLEGQREVWVVPARGGPPTNFCSHRGQDLQPVWSPDSAMIAFVSDRGGAYQIWIAPFANGRRVGEPRRITADRGTASYPTWAPDGKTIAYIVVTDEGKEVWLAPADGSGRSRRLTSGAQAGCLRWSGTSRQIVVLGLWGQQLPTLRSVSPETGELRPFPLPGTITLNPDVVDFDLSPDGRLLAFFEGRTESVVWLREAEKGSF